MTDFRSDRFHHTVHRFLEAAICPELMPAALHEIAMTCNAAGAIALPVAGDRLIAPVVSEGCAELLVDFLKWPNPARNSRMERGLRLYSRGWRGFATDHDSFTPEELARDAFQQEFMRPRGFGSYAGATIVQTGGYSLPITLERFTSQGPFEAAEVRQMNKLISQISDAAAFALRMSLVSASRMTDAMAQTGQPLAIIGADGRVLHVNALFETLIGQGLILRNGCLAASDAAADKALAATIGRAVGYNGELEKPLGAIVIPRPPERRPIVLNVIPLAGAALDIFQLARAVVLATDLEQDMPPDMRVLQEVFGLTAAEAMLAAQIVSGKDLSTIAIETGRSRETLRSRLKSIFDKTGTSRQAELALLLAKFRLPI